MFDRICNPTALIISIYNALSDYKSQLNPPINTPLYLLSFSEKKMQVLWLRFLTEINEKTLEAPAEMLENPEVSEALKILEVAAYTPAEMRAYDKFWDAISSDKTIIEDYEYKLEQAKAEAEEAKAKLKQKDIDTARKMKSDGMPVELIAKYTGLTAEEIETLYK